MKKYLSIIMVGVLLLLTLTNCTPKEVPSDDTSKETTSQSASSSTASQDKEKTELVLWMPPFGTEDALDKSFWEDNLSDFATQNNVELTVEIVPWGNYEEKYLTGITSGSGPDVGYMYIEMISDFINMGAIEPLDSYITQEDRENYLYLDKGFIQGQQYTLPIIVGNARILVGNMDLLNDAGITEVPTTWDELIATGKILREKTPDIIPFAQPWGEPAIGALNSLYYPYLWQAGGEIFTDDASKLALDSPEALEATQFLYDLRFKHDIISENAMSYTNNDVIALLNDEKVALTVIDCTNAAKLGDQGINWDFVPFLTNKSGGTFVAADALIMTSNSDNKELAAKLMKTMTSGDIMTKFHHELAMFPPVAKDEEYNDHAEFKDMYANNAADLRTLPAVAGSFKAYDSLYKNLQLMMMGELSPEEALSYSVEYSENVLSN